MSMAPREHERIPCVVKVEFRTPSSFLVAYSVNLSRGGMFLETGHEVSVGEQISLHFDIPGIGVIDTVGTVMWRRDGERSGSSGRAGARADSGSRAVSGVGIRFDNIEGAVGEIIDRLVGEYCGTRILLVFGRHDASAAIGRMVHDVVATAEIVSAFDIPTAEAEFDTAIDLVIIAADEPFALEVLDAAKKREPPIPVLAMSATGRSGDRARELGADEVVSNPPAFDEFHRAMIHALGRPLSVA